MIDASHCPHVGGAPHERIATFDVDLPELEKLLRAHTGFVGVSAKVIGGELIPRDQDGGGLNG